MISAKKKKINPAIYNSVLVFLKAQMSAFVGGLTDYCVMLFFTEVFHLHYTISIVIGGVIGAVVNFSLNKTWAFHSHFATYSNSMRVQFIKFVLVVVNSIFLKSYGTYVVTTFMLVDYKISRVIIDLFVSLACNYPLQKYWVFRKEKTVAMTR